MFCLDKIKCLMSMAGSRAFWYLKNIVVFGVSTISVGKSYLQKELQKGHIHIWQVDGVKSVHFRVYQIYKAIAI